MRPVKHARGPRAAPHYDGRRLAEQGLRVDRRVRSWRGPARSLSTYPAAASAFAGTGRAGAPASLITPNTTLGAMAGQVACKLCGRGIEPRGRGNRPVYCKPCMARADKEIGRMPRVDCKECGKAFSTKTRSVHYCSDACRFAATRRANIENQRRYEADPEKRALKRARARLAAAARRARARGEEPPPIASRDVGSLKRNASAAEPYACGLCGRDFAPYGGNRPTYCKRCTAKTDREIGRAMAVDCKECGKEFSTLNRIVVYCSKACRAAGRMRSTNEGARRRRADPEASALAAARRRAQYAARKGGKKGAAGG